MGQSARGLMLEVVDAVHAYGPGRRARPRLARRPPRRVPDDPGRERLRQDHAAAHHLRARAAEIGRAPRHRRHRRRRRAAPHSATARPCSRATRSSRTCRSPRMSATGSRCAACPRQEIAKSVAPGAGAGAARAEGRAAHQPAFRRRAPAGGARPRAGHAAGGAPPRRAARRARREAAHRDAVRAGGDPAIARRAPSSTSPTARKRRSP